MLSWASVNKRFLLYKGHTMNRQKPLITIVTITLNIIKTDREKYFRQCLESVHNQTYQNIEHIVIDGASKDGTENLLKEYFEKGWIKYISEPDSGIYDAMNKGVRLAKGKYIAFLSSDDYYHSNKGVEETVEEIEKYKADFSFAPARMLNENESVINYSHPHCAPRISQAFFLMPFCHQTMFTKKTVMIAENMFDTNYKSAGDYDFVIRLCLKKYKSIFVKKSFVTFRFGGESDKNQKLSKDEISKSYFNNYNKLIPITKKECEKIYCSDYDNSPLRYYPSVPLKLAKILSNYTPYFNYEEYLQNKKSNKKLKRKVINHYNKLRYGKISQPVRKVYRLLGLKK